MNAFMLRWLSIGLGIALPLQPAGAMPPDTAMDKVAETKEPEDVESPVSNPEIADALAEVYSDLFDSGCRAWNTLTSERLQTVCATAWIKRTN